MRYSSTKESYSEVYEIINFLGDEYKNKIPKRLYDFINNNREKKYKPDFSFNNIESLNEKSISRKAVAIIAFLNSHYWSEDQVKIDKLEQIYIDDQNRFKDEVIEDYDDELLCNSGPNLDTEETTLPVLAKEKWYKRLLKKILSLFRKNNNNQEE